MKFEDLESLPEDERIERVGQYVMSGWQRVAIAVDDEPAKIERYKRKLLTRFPDITILSEGKGTPGSHIILVQQRMKGMG
jgi:hypothetical protein